MTYTSELIRKGDKKQIWEKYCGFLDLSMQEYMKIEYFWRVVPETPVDGVERDLFEGV